MGLRDLESTLPPGFRFYPSDEELVCHYLHKKVANERISQGTMVEVDLHTREPWELPEVAKLTANEWYFFSFRDRKYTTGSRTNRATKTGYWKATGKDRMINNPATREPVGMRKTLVFYQGRAPNGVKTGWVMHEFRLETPHSPPKEDWVLCRVFQKKKGDNEHDTASPISHTPGSYNPMVDHGALMNDFCDQISLGFPTEAVLQVGGGCNPFLTMPMFQHDCTSFDTAHEFNSSTPMMGLSSKAVCGSSGTNDHGFHYDMTSNLESTWFPM